MRIIGIDLGWNGKPAGVALLEQCRGSFTLNALDRIQDVDETLRWIRLNAGRDGALVSVDAPLIIPNERGRRTCESALDVDFRRFEAGCHSSNKGSKFSNTTTGFSVKLGRHGFKHADRISPMKPGQLQIEVYPHPATVRLFGLTKTLKYKRKSGRTIASCAGEMRKLRHLVLHKLAKATPRLEIRAGQLPHVPDRSEAALKAVEDKLDALLCAYVGAHWWYWGRQRNTVYGDRTTGYIVVPGRSCGATAEFTPDRTSPGAAADRS